MSIPYIKLNGVNVPFNQVQPIGITDTRIWLFTPPSTIPNHVPVTTQIGVPIVDMPGCVKISRENSSRKEGNNSKALVNDDPKGNIVLCDGGLPYYEPTDYESEDLTWETVVTENDEPPPVDTGDPPPPPESDTSPPDTPKEDKEIECPPINAQRVGDRSQKGDEQIAGYKLTPDGLICETIWEPVPAVEQFLPSAGMVTTTVAVATVATASALFAKPLADLLLRVVKPVVKKGIDSVKKKMGKSDKKLSRSQILSNKYRDSRGLPPLKK